MIDSKLPAGWEEAARRPPKSEVDPEPTMHAQLDDLLTATYVLVDDFLPKRRPGRPPRITDAELITLAIAQVFMGLPNDRQFLALAGYRLSHLFAYLPRQSGYNKRLRALTPQIERAINYLAFCSPGWCDQLRLLDSTPVPCAASRETVRRSEFAGIAAYGYCRSHSRYFWGFRLYLLRHNAEIGQPGLCFSAYGHKFGINHLAVPIPYHHSNLQLEEMIYGSRQSARRRQRPELLQLL